MGVRSECVSDPLSAQFFHQHLFSGDDGAESLLGKRYDVDTKIGRRRKRRHVTADAHFDGEDGGRPGALAEDHEHRLHANGTVSNVRGGKADRHEQVDALLLLRNDRTIGNRIGSRAAVSETALVSHRRIPVLFHNDALAEMRVHRV